MVSVFVVELLSHEFATACPTPSETTPSWVELFPLKVIATEAATPDAVNAAARTSAITCWVDLTLNNLDLLLPRPEYEFVK